MQKEIETIRSIVSRLKFPPGEEIPGGATPTQIEGFEQRTGLVLPEELRAWLLSTNGPCVGQGGVFGIGVDRDNLDIEEIFKWREEWKWKGWIPVAGDGCGNYYVIVASHPSGRRPVGFVDVIESSDEITYVVASNLWRFLQFYLKEDEGEDRWPFDRDFVEAEDPEITRFKDIRLPWAADEKTSGL